MKKIDLKINCVKKLTSEALSRILLVFLYRPYSIFCKRNAVSFSNFFAVLNFCFFWFKPKEKRVLFKSFYIKSKGKHL